MSSHLLRLAISAERTLSRAEEKYSPIPRNARLPRIASMVIVTMSSVRVKPVRGKAERVAGDGALLLDMFFVRDIYALKNSKAQQNIQDFPFL